MSERLRARDLAFLMGEDLATPRHTTTVDILDPGSSGFDHDRFVALVRDRIAFVPRFRQRVQGVPGGLANPVWVDDVGFDLGYHVRRSALPRPGSRDQLRELVARIVSRPLDRSRPLWEIYFVEGLEGGQVAVLLKCHQALVDGIDTVDLGQVLLDGLPGSTGSDPAGGADDVDPWRPRRRSPVGLLTEALRDTVTDPQTLIGTVSSTSGRVALTAESAGRRARGVVGALTGRRPVRPTVLEGPLSQQRRVVTLDTRLSDYRLVRDAHGGTVNDVILAAIAGGLRAWLMTRGEALPTTRHVRAVVPVSVIDEDLEATSLGSQISVHEVDLPVGEVSPVVRLHQVSYSFAAHHATGKSVAADRLAGIAGFAPTTFHAVGARVAAQEVRRGFALCVTNAPGPQSPVYAAGARLVASYPVPPLLPEQRLAIAVTSYDGGVTYGITADRDAIPDADVLGSCVLEALQELVDASGDARPRAARGRRARTPGTTSPTGTTEQED
ncbi:WS/DGAT/MGAT family O-acyltransferase [Nocardioides sp. AX2bis]|uniref:WS/DGAT/MGAT family O-acyltransferase n=1 Tax=Nocardioides sp. AX2bis TaxID=2653157 RepID=UPI0012EFF560|nr:wax ester/triacylglycerol synthase family O-acyltransferase [Nocardioides sp. AX2bis]VXB93583.1 Diacylglycerol O-acyltransferase [Nocardioides sp. AX2bis]